MGTCGGYYESQEEENRKNACLSSGADDTALQTG